jgi:hypothetical protein
MSPWIPQQTLYPVPPLTVSWLFQITDPIFCFYVRFSGQIAIHSLSTPESYSFDLKRPMRTVALEPNFSKRNTRAFVCGGMAGNLVMYEKGWLGHKQTVLHSGEGPIWQVRWREKLIAWANDLVRSIAYAVGVWPLQIS